MNRLFLKLLLFGAALSVAGCVSAVPLQPPPAAFRVPFETVERGVGGAYSEPGTDTQLVWPQIRTITSETEFSSFWSSLHRNLTPIPPLPAIDFASRDLVAVVDMVRPSGGYSIEVEEVQEGMDGIWLTIIRRKPGTGCVVSQSLTQPYHLITMRKSGKRHIPKFFDVTLPCQ